MKRIALAFVIAAALPLLGAASPARAQNLCAAYPWGSAAYAECWRRTYQSQPSSYQSQTDSFWRKEMDRRAHDKYHAGY